VGALIGFLIGYLYGTKAGEAGLEELVHSWKVTSSSDEVRDLVAGGLSMARDLVSQGRGMLAQRIQPQAGRLQRVV